MGFKSADLDLWLLKFLVSKKAEQIDLSTDVLDADLILLEN